jgi:hypothetical protein
MPGGPATSLETSRVTVPSPFPNAGHSRGCGNPVLARASLKVCEVGSSPSASSGQAFRRNDRGLERPSFASDTTTRPRRPLQLQKMNERCTNVIENKAPLWNTCPESRNVVENKGIYEPKAGMLLKTNDLYVTLSSAFGLRQRRLRSCRLRPFVAEGLVELLRAHASSRRQLRKLRVVG